MLVFPKNAEKNASTIEKGLARAPVQRLVIELNQRFASSLHYVNRGFKISSLLFLPVIHAVRLINHWFCREEILVIVNNR